MALCHSVGIRLYNPQAARCLLVAFQWLRRHVLQVKRTNDRLTAVKDRTAIFKLKQILREHQVSLHNPVEHTTQTGFKLC